MSLITEIDEVLYEHDSSSDYSYERRLREALSRARDELAKHEWVRVDSGELPDEGVSVVTFGGSSYPEFSYRLGGKWWGCEVGQWTTGITHWKYQESPND